MDLVIYSNTIYLLTLLYVCIIVCNLLYVLFIYSFYLYFVFIVFIIFYLLSFICYLLLLVYYCVLCTVLFPLLVIPLHCLLYLRYALHCLAFCVFTLVVAVLALDSYYCFTFPLSYSCSLVYYPRGQPNGYCVYYLLCVVDYCIIGLIIVATICCVWYLLLCPGLIIWLYFIITFWIIVYYYCIYLVLFAIQFKLLLSPYGIYCVIIIIIVLCGLVAIIGPAIIILLHWSFCRKTDCDYIVPAHVVAIVADWPQLCVWLVTHSLYITWPGLTLRPCVVWLLAYYCICYCVYGSPAVSPTFYYYSCIIDYLCIVCGIIDSPWFIIGVYLCANALWLLLYLL